ncbi:MAG: Chitobiose ABC transporter, permease protein 1, partial [uncultured Thermomicrobiales bacterium]
GDGGAQPRLPVDAGPVLDDHPGRPGGEPDRRSALRPVGPAGAVV